MENKSDDFFKTENMLIRNGDIRHWQHCQRSLIQFSQLQVGTQIFQSVHTARLSTGGIPITSEHLQQSQFTVEKQSDLQGTTRTRQAAVALIWWLVGRRSMFVSSTLQELKTCQDFERYVFECWKVFNKVFVGIRVE